MCSACKLRHPSESLERAKYGPRANFLTTWAFSLENAPVGIFPDGQERSLWKFPLPRPRIGHYTGHFNLIFIQFGARHCSRHLACIISFNESQLYEVCDFISILQERNLRLSEVQFLA